MAKAPRVTAPKSPDRRSRLQEFVEWSAAHITGDEKGQSQIFLDRLFQALASSKSAAPPRKAKEDGGI